MKFLILSLFPEMFQSPFRESIIARAQEKNLINIEVKNIRDFATGKRKNVDDVPFGGGAGMLMKPEPLFDAIEWAKKKLGKKSKVIFLTPQGESFTQQKAEKLAKNKDNLILLCGHFEGIDERVRQELVDEEISIGDFVLTGGELPAMCVVDAVSRLIPNVIGSEQSLEMESFSEKLLFHKEFPQYTRPANFRGLQVPAVLISGDHKKIEKWQLENIKGLSEDEKKGLKLKLNAFPLKSKRLILGLPKREYLDEWLKWINDKEVTKYLKSFPDTMTYEDEEAFFVSSTKDMRNLQLSIVDKKTKKTIGNTSLRMHPENPFSVEFGIMIGDKDYWDNGYGTETLMTLLDFSFRKADFIRVYLNVYQTNKRAIRVYEKCGFKITGEAKKYYLKNGKFQDIFIMEILKEDFLKKNGKK